MKRSVLVIGGGPAGLTAALRLSLRGHAVTLLERGRELGGRLVRAGTAQTVAAEADVVAEPVPLALLGCHTATIALLKTIGTIGFASFRRGPRLEIARPHGRPGRLWRPWAPAPLHAVLALALFPSPPLRDRWQLLMWLERIWEGESALPADLELRTAEDWLSASGQSATARTQFWNPLARFLLGDDLTVVSAAALVTMLSRFFLSARRGSRIAVPEVGAYRLLVQPAYDHLHRQGATIRLETHATQFRFDQRRVTGVQLQTGETLTADWYVAALPPSALTPLLPERVLTHFSYFHQLLKLTESPAATVHLQLDLQSSRVRLPCPVRLLLLAGRPFHWMVIRPTVKELRQAIVSLVCTGRFDVLDFTDQALRDSALAELSLIAPALAGATVLRGEVIREPRAFLSVRPGTAALRPLQQSPFSNLLLAGDWTDTGLPSTLESAVVSGDRCAEHILAASK